MEFLNLLPNNTPSWILLICVMTYLLRDVLAIFIPQSLKDIMTVKTDKQEHGQSLERHKQQAIIGQAVTAQTQVVEINKALVDFVTLTLENRIVRLTEEIADLRVTIAPLCVKDEYNGKQIKDILETLNRHDTHLTEIQTLLTTLTASTYVKPTS